MAKKPTSKPKSKATVGSAKKNVSNKKLLLMSLPIAAIVLGAGWFGWNFYQEKNLEAQAAGWTNLVTNQYASVAACKTAVTKTQWTVRTRMTSYSAPILGTSYVVTPPQTFYTIASYGVGTEFPANTTRINSLTVPRNNTQIMLIDMGVSGSFDQVYSEGVKVRDLARC